MEGGGGREERENERETEGIQTPIHQFLHYTTRESLKAMAEILPALTSQSGGI